FFATEVILGVLHVLGGVVMLIAPSLAHRYQPQTDGSAFAQPFVLALLAHMLFYMPTLGLTGSISFAHLKEGERGFPLVRVFGTIGWIVANQVVSLLPGKDDSGWQFYLTGSAAILLGVYSFSLPHTPPPGAGRKPSLWQIAGLDALKLCVGAGSDARMP